MFEQLARIETMFREHAPNVVRELTRAVDALDAIAMGVATIARVIQLSDKREVIIDGEAIELDENEQSRH